MKMQKVGRKIIIICESLSEVKMNVADAETEAAADVYEEREQVSIKNSIQSSSITLATCIRHSRNIIIFILIFIIISSVG